jgi:TPR repeat protein
MKKTTVIMVLLLLFTFDLSAKKKLTLIPTSHKTQKLEMGKDGRDGYENNRKIAVKYYKLGCDGQDILSCSRLAIFYQKEDTLKKKALRLLEDTCKRANLSQTHDYSACSSAGEAYRYGTGTDKNLMMAISYYKISCERDRVLYNLAKNESSFSCKDLKSTQAELKNQGKSKPYLEKAISLLKEECENKHNVLSCKHLSGIYDKGKGVDIDKNMALKYTKKINIFQ